MARKFVVRSKSCLFLGQRVKITTSPSTPHCAQTGSLLVARRSRSLYHPITKLFLSHRRTACVRGRKGLMEFFCSSSVQIPANQAYTPWGKSRWSQNYFCSRASKHHWQLLGRSRAAALIRLASRRVG